MADESKQNGKETRLFKNLVFFMRPCKERQELRQTIENKGGKITSKATGDCFKLAEKGSIVSREGYITSDYVQDCIKQRKMLSTDKYKVKQGTVVRAESDLSHSRCSSEDSFEHASVIIKTAARNCKGRTKYTKEEDVAIMTYLIEEHRYSEATGKKVWKDMEALKNSKYTSCGALWYSEARYKAVWKDMEALKITDHPAESMSCRYRKHILENLDKYKYDIEKSWMSRLRGYVVKEKEPEFSFDALFSKRRKQPLQMTTSPTKRKKDGPSSEKTKTSTESSDQQKDKLCRPSSEKIKTSTESSKQQKDKLRSPSSEKMKTSTESSKQQKDKFRSPNSEKIKTSTESSKQQKDKLHSPSSEKIKTSTESSKQQKDKLRSPNSEKTKNLTEPVVDLVDILTASPSKRQKDKPQSLSSEKTKTSTESSKQQKDKLRSEKMKKLTEPVVDLVDILSVSPIKQKQKSAKDNKEINWEKKKCTEQEQSTRSVDDVDDQSGKSLQKKGKEAASPAKVVEILQLDDGQLVAVDDDIEDVESDFDESLETLVKKSQKRTHGDDHCLSPTKKQKQKSSNTPHKELSTSKTNDKVSEDINGPRRTRAVENKNSNSVSILTKVVINTDSNSQSSHETLDSFDDVLNDYLLGQSEKGEATANNDNIETNTKASGAVNSDRGNWVAPAKETNTGHGEIVSTGRTVNEDGKQLTNGHINNNITTRTRSKTKGKTTPRRGNVHINLSVSDDDDDDDDGDDVEGEEMQCQLGGTSSHNKTRQKTTVTETTPSATAKTAVQDIVDTCKAVAADFGISASYVKELLYGFSGDVRQMLRWINFGPDFIESGPWTEADDKRLFEGELKYLVSKYGKDSVKARAFFFEEQ